MIYSDEQYQHSVDTLKRFEVALARIAAVRSDDDWLKQVEIDAIKSQISTIHGELSHYESLRAGNVSQETVFSLESLPTVLIETRIASGMSQADLARALGIGQLQVQQWEDSDYLGANPIKLLDIAKTLDVQVDGNLAATMGKGRNQVGRRLHHRPDESGRGETAGRAAP